MHAGHHARTPSYSGIEGIIFYVSHLFVDIDILIYILDITMHSPPKEHIPAYGSSRSTGGTFRGRAVGNTFNIADVRQVWGDVNCSDGEPIKGKIYLYISDLNPAVVDISQSSFVVNVYDTAKCQTVQDLMKRGSRDYSPIRSKLLIYIGCFIDILDIRACISSVHS